MKLKLFLLLILASLSFAEDKVYLLVDNHIGFDGNSFALQIFDKWCDKILKDCDESPYCDLKFSVYMLGEEGFSEIEAFSMPGKPSTKKLKCWKGPDGQWAQYDSKFLEPKRNEVIAFIESVARPAYVDIAGAINRVANESFREGDTRTIYVISDYQRLPKEYAPIAITKFEEDRVPVRLCFTNVDDDEKLLNSVFQWDKTPEEKPESVFKALRCYSRGEFK